MKTSVPARMLALASLCLAGCAVTPSTIVQGPTSSVRPQAAAPAVAGNGAIFQAAAYRPLFEDRRARMIGDILTIRITENTNAAKSAANSDSKSGAATVSVPTLFGVPATTTAKLGVSAAGDTKFDEKGGASASNNFNGTIGVTVIDVLSNGNLVVSGEKQIAIDKGTEFVRFSGIVNPDTIVTGNVVSSTQVADARVEYRTNSRIDQATITSMLTRFFLSVLPL